MIISFNLWIVCSVNCLLYTTGITDSSGVNATTNLIDLGLDSLMTTEIKQIMERQFKIVLTVAEIRKLTVKQLRGYNKEKDTVQKKGKQDNTVKQYRVTVDMLLPLEEIVPIKIVENDTEPVFIVNMLPGKIVNY